MSDLRPGFKFVESYVVCALTLSLDHQGDVEDVFSYLWIIEEKLQKLVPLFWSECFGLLVEFEDFSGH